MAITRVTGVTASAINAGSTTLNFDESLCLTNDLILVAWSCGDDDFTQPTLAMTTAGYTELTTSTLSADGGTGGDGNLAVFYKYFASGDVSAVTAASGTGTDSSNATACQIFRGVATVAEGGPLEVAIQTATGTTGGDPNPPSVSGFDEATAVVVIAGASSKATSSETFAAPANYATNFLTVGSAAETFCAAVGLGYNEAPADPEDPAAMTSTNNVAWCAATLVLKEAPAAITRVYDQIGFRGYLDDGAIDAATPIANENIDWSQVVDTNFRVRFVVDETANGTASIVGDFKLQYNKNAAGWNDVGIASSVVRTFDGVPANGAATTRQLTSGTGTFVAGSYDENNGAAASANTIDSGELTEMEYCVQVRSVDVVNNDTIDLRLVETVGSTVFGTYSQTPTITVIESAGPFFMSIIAGI